jgi:hypothetical protein
MPLAITDACRGQPWKVKLQTGDSNNSASVAALGLIYRHVDSSERPAQPLRSQCGMLCRKATFDRPCARRSAGVCRDKPRSVVDLDPHDWTTILQRSDAAVLTGDASETHLCYDLTLRCAARSVKFLARRSQHPKPKTFWKLGSCETPMRRVLRRRYFGSIMSDKCDYHAI